MTAVGSAPSLVALSSRVAARHTGEASAEAKDGSCGILGAKTRACIPDFDRAAERWKIIRGDDFCSIGRECDGIDLEIVGVGLLALELKRSCQGRQDESV